MTYLGALPKRLHRQETPIVLLTAALLFAFAALRVAGAADAEELQKQGIQKVNQYRDYMRRTGDVNARLSELLSAQAPLRLSADAFLAQQNPAGAALSFLRLGDIERWQNHWDAARSLYSRARQLAKQARNAQYEAQALTQLTRTELLGKGDLGAAAEYIRQAIPLATTSNNQDCLFDALDEAGNLEIKRGNLNAAADYLDRALALKDQLQDKSLAMSGYADRGDIFYQRGAECDYDTHFSICDDAFQKSHDDYLQASNVARASLFDFMADQMQKLMENVDAKRHLIQTRGRYSGDVTDKTSGLFHPKKDSDVLVNPRFTPGPNPQRQAQLDALIRATIPNIDAASDPTGLYVQGMSAEMKGDNETALTSFKKAVALIERDRRNLRDEQSRGTFLEDKITLYYSPALLLLDLKRNAEAFDLLERSRSRAMADLLSGSLKMRTPLERDLFSQWMKLKEDIALQQKKLFEMNSDKDSGKHADDIADTKARIAELEQQSEKAQANIAAKAPRLGQLTESPSVSLTDAQMSARRDDYDLLYYLVVENNVIIWDINGQNVKVLSVFLPHTQLSARVASVRQSLVAHENDPNAKFDAETSRELFLFLIQPVLSSIRTRHIVVVPHEDLNNLTFEALQDPADGSYLGEKFQISYTPSATVLASLKGKPNLARGRLLAVADPTMVDSMNEVRAIGALYQGRSKVVEDVPVKKEEVKAWVGGYDLVHLAMHGIFQAGDPMLSYLKLASTDRDDGRLTAAEMFGLPLAEDSTVVLSACQTGEVQATHSNEILGMVRALLYAGANHLVLSSWRVRSQSTTLWMESFYRAAQTNPPSEAARLARLAVKARPAYRDPYFWAAFALTGK
jgi:CHAT domain-containing protein/tetratricopeptide (TPR) repeat protein